jgi:cytochrome oxidase Cu insertion factor (SCO1/SenC/PrrC family)
MRKTALSLAVGIASIAALASTGIAQATTPTPVAMPTGPQVGDAAPDFSLPGSTRYGLLTTPVKLSDFRGKTVVLAFFYQARTKG